jgi:hypothetical protein
LALLHELSAYLGNAEMNPHCLLELDSGTVEFASIRPLSVIFDQWGIDQCPPESLYQLMAIDGYKPE